MKTDKKNQIITSSKSSTPPLPPNSTSPTKTHTQTQTNPPCIHNLEEELHASPLHLHVGENARLQGKPQPRSRSHSRSRSRDASPYTNRNRNRSHSRSRRNSSSTATSIEDLDVDPDILTDRMGHEELSLDQCHSHRDSIANTDSLANSLSTLPCVNERMSEEALEDVHAFTDLKDVIRQISRDNIGNTMNTSGTAASSASASGISSRSSETSLSAAGSLIGDGGHLLETLEEFEGENEEGSSEGGSEKGDLDANANYVHVGDAILNVEEEKKKLLLLKKKEPMPTGTDIKE